MAKLVLGPMLRYVGTDEATIWVEADAHCEVEVLGHRESTFRVGGQHYAIVIVRGLMPDASIEYDVRLDGKLVWPRPGSALPPSRIQTLPTEGPLEIAFGSCRVTAPHEPPHTLGPDEDAEGLGLDALHALALRLEDQDPHAWPRLLLLIGDQVYADEVSPQTQALIRARRDVSVEPGEEVLDFQEYTWLYREAWSPPALRWLLSTIPTAMIFDDHDVRDDWNISESWVEETRATPWWGDRIVGALATYWIYQHLGNLSPAQLERDSLYTQVLAAEDAAPLLREFAIAAEREGGGSLWSFSRQLAGTRLVVIDGREGRVLTGGRREILDENEWRWVEEELTGEFDHVLIANTLPVLLAPTLHYVEAWNEAVCQGSWGKTAARLSEKLRRGIDLEHWAAFQSSFHRMIDLIMQVGSGHRGTPPASIVLLGGDVHQAYLESVGFRRSSQVHSAVYQAVCSPFRHQLAKRERRILTIVRRSRIIGWLARRLALAAGVRDPEARWQVVQAPTFDNQLGRLHIDGRRLGLIIEAVRSRPEPELVVTLKRQLVGRSGF
ncbi:MAG: alkaline phosphatase D family protein [Solirubrobacteraceae bacterium]